MIANLLTAVVALLHLGFMTLEMFFWQRKEGMKIFGLTQKLAADTATLAKNQGLYNGFLAAGLIWSFFIGNVDFQSSIRIFFLVCVIAAGVFGAITAKRTILYVQALPAALALLAVLLNL